MSTQEEHPIHHILSVTPFSVNYNKTHKSRLPVKHEIKYKLQSFLQHKKLKMCGS